MPTEEQEAEGFDYQGYLIFNDILQVDFSDASQEWNSFYKAEEKMFKELGEFQRARKDANRGLKRLDLRNYIRDNDFIDTEELESVADGLISYRFKYEDLVEEEGYTAGGDELEEVQIPVINDADIYWNHPDYIFFRGSEGDVSEAVDFTSSIMKSRSGKNGRPSVKGKSFDKYFLLWLFYRYCNNEKPRDSREFDMTTLTDASISGEDDAWGGSNVVGDSSDISQSPPLLSTLLKNKSFTMLEGGFSVQGNSVLAEVQKNKVHLKVAKSINRSNKVRRIAISIQFLTELVELHDYWDGLGRKEKYPPYDFFLDLHQTCQAQGMDLDSISHNLREDLCDRRRDAKTDWGL